MSPHQSAQISHEEDVERDIHIKEWEKARDVLQFFDDKLHDLRKYGFSFVTGLLAADGILLSSKQGEIAPDSFKFAVCFITLILILALYLIDKNYTVFQKAAATRALVLERKLNIELSEIISDRYSIGNIERNVLGVYGLFIVGVLILGWISLGAQNGYVLILLLFALVVIIYIFQIGLKYKYNLYEDWTISPLACSMDGTVKITLNNFSNKNIKKGLLNTVKDMFHKKGIQKPEPIRFKKSALLWEIINEETGEIRKQSADRDMKIYDNQTWILKGKDFGKAGVYQLRPRDWPIPLHRRIVITDIQNIRVRKK